MSDTPSKNNTSLAAPQAQEEQPTSPMDVSNSESENKAKMLACCFVSKENVEMRVVPKVELTDPQDVIVKVTGTTVCGSDLHLYHGELMELKPGDILGHECVGVVEQVGPDVKSVKAGDRVVAAFNIACGQCAYCQKQLYTACECTNQNKNMEKLYGHRLAGIMGYSHFLGGFSGSQAEFCRVLFGDTNLLKLPDDVPDEKALFLSDIVPTSYHAVCESGSQEGDVVGVWGLGPIGLNVCQWLRNVVKVKTIIAIDSVPERLELAEKHWDVIPLNINQVKDVQSTIMELAPSGLDRAIDCAGFRYTKEWVHHIERAVGAETDSSEVVNEMIRSTKKFGTIALIADYMAYANHVLLGGIMEKGIRFIGCGQAPVQKYWDTCLKAIQTGQFDPTVILTHRFSLEETDKVYRCFDKKEAGIIKTFIQTKNYKDSELTGLPKLTRVDDA